MGKNQIKYFNFPISLLANFLNNPDKSLDDIFNYAIYDHAFNKLNGPINKKLKDSLKYFGAEIQYPLTQLKEKGEEIYFDTECKVKVGLNTRIYWDFLDTKSRSEFDFVCLLAYLGLKSIIQKKPYCKITNLFWLSRMDGNAKAVWNNEELTPQIQKYANEYQLKKIKAELIENWNLIHYSRFTRGFYVSFSMELKELIYQVEKKRKSIKVKNQQKEQKEALEAALKRLESDV